MQNNFKFYLTGTADMEKLTNITKLQNINFVVSSELLLTKCGSITATATFYRLQPLALSAIIIYYDDIY